MDLNYLKVIRKDYVSKSLQKYEEMFDETLDKYTGYDYTIVSQADVSPRLIKYPTKYYITTEYIYLHVIHVIYVMLYIRTYLQRKAQDQI